MYEFEPVTTRRFNFSSLLAGPVKMKKNSRGTRNYEIFSISNSLKRLEKLNICRRQVM